MSDETPRRLSLARLIPLAVLLIAGLVFLALGGGHYLSFAALAANRQSLLDAVARAGLAAPAIYIAAYTALVAFSLPGAALMTMTGGFLFGPWWGTAYAVTGATAGATVVFLAARAGLAGVAGRAGRWARRFEAGVRQNALSYLLLIHLVPLVPFWVVNLMAGALGLRLWVFVVGTFFGIIPLAFVYAGIGNGLGALASGAEMPGLGVLLRPEILLPLLVLAAVVLLSVVYRRRRAASRG